MRRRDELELPELVRKSGDESGLPGLLDVVTELGPSSVPASPGLRARLLAEVGAPRRRFAPFFDTLRDLFDLDDEALAALFERAACAGQWCAAEVPHVRLLHLRGGPRVAIADNGLVRLPPGARFPLHHHLGPERVLVLAGGYQDEPSGRVYAPGDLHELPAASVHAYTALPERELLLAVSVVGGVKLEGAGALAPPGVKASD